MAGEKLTIKYTEGCINYSLSINDKESTKLSLKEIREVLDKVLDKLTNKETCPIESNAAGIIQDLLIDLVETYGES